jgi:hypothetical protein
LVHHDEVIDMVIQKLEGLDKGLGEFQREQIGRFADYESEVRKLMTMQRSSGNCELKEDLRRSSHNSSQGLRNYN